MKITDFYNLLDKEYPFELSKKLCDDKNFYDNSGILVETNEEITGAVFCLDLTKSAVDFAKEKGCNLIVTHHPVIYSPIKKIDGALLYAIQNEMGIISAHLNLDVAKRGIDYYFAKGLGAKDCKILTELGSKCGYGRIFEVDKTFSEIIEKAETEFATKVIAYGDKDKIIKKVASFCGAGFEEGFSSIKADLICSSDEKHHIILELVESGKCVLCFTHYATENYGFMKLYEDFLENKAIKNKMNLYYFCNEKMF